MDLGVTTFADLPPGMTPRQRMRNLLEEAELADQVGLDVFGLGEHHRPDFILSSPAVALAADPAWAGLPTPGPAIGAGLPALALFGAGYWMIRRLRRR